MIAKRLLFALLLMATCLHVRGQARLQGTIRDSVQNIDMPSATVALYQVADSALLSFQLSTDKGVFNFAQAPTGKPLFLKIFYTGYKTLLYPVTLKGNLDLKTINMAQNGKQLQGVEVKGLAPVQMNGDTLEFNADAFKLQETAVGEDLLKKLPGVVVWADGTITVNGKQVSNVTVDGKPFFGGNTKVATQNLPKNAIDKIQVFQLKEVGRVSPDSTTAINIKLKKDRNFGLFGKLGAGAGTGAHYDATGNLNAFSPHNQFSIVAAGNNVNKSAMGYNDLMEQSTFKGVRASLLYMPDIQMAGLNKLQSFSGNYQHNFGAANDFMHSADLRVALSRNVTDNRTAGNTHSVSTLGGDSSLTKDELSTQNNHNVGTDLTGQYTLRNNNLNANVNFNAGKTNSYGNSSNVTTTPNAVSTDNSASTGDASRRGLAVAAGHNAIPSDKPHALPKTWQLFYSYDGGESNTKTHRMSGLEAPGTPSQNQQFDRLYNTGTRENNHQFRGSLGNLAPWLLGKADGFAMDISADAKLSSLQSNVKVLNLDTASHQYVADNYLTVQENLRSWRESPQLSLRKTFQKKLDVTHFRTWTIVVNGVAEMNAFSNTSSQAQRNISRHYQAFLPGANIHYNLQQGMGITDVSLGYNASRSYPRLDDLQPIVDSANLLNLTLGNMNLKPIRSRAVNLLFNHVSVGAKGGWSYALNVSATKNEGLFLDKVLIDSLGRSVHTKVNSGAANSYSNMLSLRRSFRWKGNELQLTVTPSAVLNYTQALVNGHVLQSPVLNVRAPLGLSYTFKETVSMVVQDGFTIVRSKPGGEQVLVSRQNNLVMAASVNCTQRWEIGSQVTYNHSGTTAGTTDFTIWNMHTSYRCLRGRNLEVQLLGSDLLHQNKGVVTVVAPGLVATRVNNALQQYFMITVAYFPRMFGKAPWQINRS